MARLGARIETWGHKLAARRERYAQLPEIVQRANQACHVLAEAKSLIGEPPLLVKGSGLFGERTILIL